MKKSNWQKFFETAGVAVPPAPTSKNTYIVSFSRHGEHEVQASTPQEAEELVRDMIANQDPAIDLGQLYIDDVEEL